LPGLCGLGPDEKRGVDLFVSVTKDIGFDNEIPADDALGGKATPIDLRCDPLDRDAAVRKLQDAAMGFVIGRGQGASPRLVGLAV
jgi:hypothetical protein